MTQFPPAYLYVISFVVVLLGSACSTFSFLEDDKLTPSAAQETAKPSPPPAQKDQLHEVRGGETLSGIALVTTGDARNWKAIADLNNITDPNTIKQSQIILIPQSLIPSPTSTALAESTPGSTGKKPLRKPGPVSEPPVQDSTLSREKDGSTQNSISDPEKPLAREQEKAGGWLIIRGTNYPREINFRPDSSSDILTQAWPGTRMKYTGKKDGWYKVVTEKGPGYLNPDYGSVQP